MTAPGIPNEFVLSTSCFGTRLKTIEDQAFAAVAMGFRQIELGMTDSPPTLTGFEDTRRETGVRVSSVVSGCLKPMTEKPACQMLASANNDEREQALGSVRRPPSDFAAAARASRPLAPRATASKSTRSCAGPCREPR